MTRKRYIKLLVSQGVSRNQANDLARHVFFKYKSYEEGYKMWKLMEFFKRKLSHHPEIGLSGNRAEGYEKGIQAAMSKVREVYKKSNV